MTLATIQRGRTPLPPRLVLYGTEGIGKSTFAASAPKPIFIQTEDGLGEIDCDKFPLAETFEDVLTNLAALVREEHDYQTIAIDSLDWLERLIFEALCRQQGAASIEAVGGGYGKGYTLALGQWQRVLEALGRLRARGMLVLCLAHARIEKFNDPESSPYDRYSLDLNKHAAALVSEWSDAVLFATRKIRTQQEDTGFGRTRTTAKPVGRDGGERVIRAIGGPACVAKNRYNLPDEIPLSWDAFINAMTQAQGAKANG